MPQPAVAPRKGCVDLNTIKEKTYAEITVVAPRKGCVD